MKETQIQSQITPSQFAEEYFEYLSTLMKRIPKQSINALIALLEEMRLNENTLYIAGNGGSAATATHMSSDWTHVTQGHVGKKPLKVMSLVDNMSLVTATANDEGYQHVFTKPLKTFFKEKDALLVVSASGNSSNLVQAAQWVKEHGGKVIGFLGFDGGALKDICDLSIWIETRKGAYGPVEDLHMILDHLVYSWYRQEMGESWK